MASYCSCTVPQTLTTNFVDTCKIFTEAQRFSLWLSQNITDPGETFNERGGTISAANDTATVVNTASLLYIWLPEVTTNVTVDRSSLNIVTEPTNGTLTIVNMPDKIFKYTPDAGYTGVDSFTYGICNNAPFGTICDTATVTITVT